MKNFDYLNTTRIIFGRKTEEDIGKYVKQFGSRVMIHYGSHFTKRSGLIDKIVKSLNNSGLEFILEFGGVRPNPRLGLIREGIEVCRKNNIDFILAVGGGSVIDSAKAIGLGIGYDGDVWDFYQGRASVIKTVPVGVVLTIPAAGSEASNGTVITNEDGWYKRSVNSRILYPKFAIMNPELTFTLPPYQTACGIADIMAHVLERYFTSTDHVDLTDGICESMLKTLIDNGRIVLKNTNDYDARAEIMWAGTIAQNGLLSTGRSGDWASHMIEHEITAIYDVAHGAGLAVIFPAWMRFVYKNDINRFEKFATRVWGVDDSLFQSHEAVALEGIRKTREFFGDIGLPVTLRELNILDDKFEEMALKCTENGLVGDFKKLERDDVLNILKMAL